MDPLVTTKRILIWMCMYPAEKLSRWRSAARIAFVVMQFCITLFAVSAYMAFIVENIATDLENVLLTFMAFVACSNLIYVMIVAFFVRHQVPSIFKQLSNIYAAGKFNPVCN